MGEKDNSTNNGLVTILESFLTKSDTNLGIRHSFDPNNLKRYIEPFELIDRVKEISKEIGSLTEMQRTATMEFIKACENRKQVEIRDGGDDQKQNYTE